MIALLAALAFPLQGEVAPPAAMTAPLSEPAPIRISMIGGARYGSGDRVRVQVQTADDGYLVVLRVDTDGHIRVLFPIDPDLDAFVRGGKSYELRGRADRQTFLADEHNGTGQVFAAVAVQPMRFNAFSVGDHWDYDALRLRDNSTDPEAELTRIVARMTGNAHFDYDILDYTVNSPYISANGGAYPTSYGSYYNGYDPYLDCLSCRWGYRPFSVNIGFGSYSPFYDPYRFNSYDPYFYDPYYYGYNNYPGSFYRYPGQSYPITVVNLPRPHIPTTSYGLRSRPRPPIVVPPGNLARPIRDGALGGGSVGAGSSGAPGTYVGDRGRQPSSRQPSRGSEPPTTSSPPPRVDRTPPSPGGSGSSGAGSAGSVGTRSRPRGGGDAQDASSYVPTQRTVPASIERRNDEPRPVYREPPRAQPATPPARDNGRQEQPRPVYREPPRVERSSPPPPPPATRSSPPPPPPAAPPKSSSSGSGSSSGSTRSRPGGGGH